MNQTTLISRNLLLPLYLNRNDVIVMRVKDELFGSSLYYFIEDDAEVTIIVEDKQDDQTDKHRNISKVVLCVESPGLVDNFMSKLNNVLVSSVAVFNCGFYDLSGEDGLKDTYLVIEKGHTRIKAEPQRKKCYTNNIDAVLGSCTASENGCVREQKLYRLSYQRDRTGIVRFSKSMETPAFAIRVKAPHEIDVRMVASIIKDQLITFFDEFLHDSLMLCLDRFVYLRELNVYIALSCDVPASYLHFDNLKEKTKIRVLNFISQPENYAVTKDGSTGYRFEYLNNAPYVALCSRLVQKLKSPHISYYGCAILGDHQSGKSYTLNRLVAFLAIPYCVINVKKILANYTTVKFAEVKDMIESALARNMYSSRFILCVEDVHYLLAEADPNDPNSAGAALLRNYVLRLVYKTH